MHDYSFKPPSYIKNHTLNMLTAVDMKLLYSHMSNIIGSTF